MKHRNKRFLSVLLGLALLLGLVSGMTLTAYAAATPQMVTLDFTGDDWSIPSTNTTGANTYSNGTCSVSLYAPDGYRQDNSYLLLGRSGAYLQLPAFNFPVGKIVVTGKGGASGKVRTNIYVGDSAVSSEATGSQDTNTFEIASDYQTAGTVYRLQITSAHNAQITSITIHEKEASQPVEPPAPATTYGAYVPTNADDSDALDAKVVTFNGYAWYIIEDNSTAVDEGTVTLLAKEAVGQSVFNDNTDFYVRP